VRADVGQRQAPAACQRMVAGRDQHRPEAVDRPVADIVGHLDHRADRKIDTIRAQHAQPVGAGDVVQLHVDARMTLAEALHQAGQQVQDGRFAGRNPDFAGVHSTVGARELVGQCVEPVDQWPGQLQQGAAGRGQLHPRPMAFEQLLPQFLFQLADLLADRWL